MSAPSAAVSTASGRGQCLECGVWNTLSEIVLTPSSIAKSSVGAQRSSYAGNAAGSARITPLTEVALTTEARTHSGIGELDRVLGGGLVQGSVVLIGGDPGIGKSTLLLQVLGTLGAQLSSVYVTGEESLSQVASRAQRLGLPLEPLQALAETCIERILEQALATRPRVLVIDSIQTIWTELLTAAPGSVSQVRESAAKLTRFAKETGTSVFLVGHVTKEGGIAGPHVLEHMVDAVLYFEGESGSRFRILRAFKNRFGAVNELGVFAMSDKGLREVPNPSAIFLSAHTGPTSGSAVMVTREGSRPLLVEVQALGRSIVAGQSASRGAGSGSESAGHAVGCLASSRRRGSVRPGRVRQRGRRHSRAGNGRGSAGAAGGAVITARSTVARADDHLRRGGVVR